MKKVIIIPYFGKFPNYFDLTLSSLEKNPDIDFLFFTDIKIHSENDNIKVISVTWGELQKYIRSKFDFEINIEKPYKLCDYRPCYGYIFQEYIKEYDFWGFGDVDLIHGRILFFLPDELFANYDRLLDCGHLTFIRNNEENNLFFKKHFEGYLNYKDVLSKDGSYRFDETGMGGQADVLINLFPDKICTKKDYDDLWIPRRFYGFRAVNHNKNCFLHYHYYKGRLFRIWFDFRKMKFVSEESMYVHMQKRSMKIRGIIDHDDFYIFSDFFQTFKNISIVKELWYSRPHRISNIVYKIYKKLRNE